jgi:hypothetical protein
MRMRKLGHGQRVTFLASSEVIPLIEEAASCKAADIKSEHVLIWTIKETWRHLQANLPAYILQGHSFVRREEAWKKFEKSDISHRELAEHLREKESRTLKELYGPGTAKADSNLNEEKEVELVHEQEVEQIVERPNEASAAEHSLEQDVITFITTGVVPDQSMVFFTVDRALLHTMIPIPQGLPDAFKNILVTKDFYHTIHLPSAPSQGCMDDFIRPVDWLVIPTGPNPSYVVALSPFEANKLIPIIKRSKAVCLHPFAPRNSRSMRSFEDFDTFTLPSQRLSPPVPSNIVHQINMFAGSIFLRDYATYRDVCKMLGLHFGGLDFQKLDIGSSTESDAIDSTNFICSSVVRDKLGVRFSESPIPFLKSLLINRRHGQSLGPSHMGKMLHGSKLNEANFMD